MHLFNLNQKHWGCPKTSFRFKTNTNKIFLRHKSRIPNSPAMSDIDIVRVSLDGWLRRVNWEVNSAEQDRQYRSGLFIRPSIAVGRVRHSSAACRQLFMRRSLIVRQSHSCRPRHSPHSDARKRWRHADKFANTDSQREIARFYFSAGVGATKILDFPVAI